MNVRKRFAHHLSIFLSALLAWPSYVPISAPEPATAGSNAVEAKSDRAGTYMQGRERKALLEDSGWSVLADNFEGSDGRDEFPCALPAFGFFPLDLPSLVPSTFEPRLSAVIDGSSSFWLSSPLRC